MTILIDAHQHYWQPSRGDYGWMPKDDPILSQPYAPQDLQPALTAAGITKTVLVQAAPTIEETEYMLGIADATPSVGAVVGWIDFENQAHLRHLERLKNHPKFSGVRPMIQDIKDTDWMLRDDVQWGFAALSDLDLTFDALGFSRHLANFLTILKRFPKMRAVIDHCMKPQIGNHGTSRSELAYLVARHGAAGGRDGGVLQAVGAGDGGQCGLERRDPCALCGPRSFRLWSRPCHVRIGLAGLPSAGRI